MLAVYSAIRLRFIWMRNVLFRALFNLLVLFVYISCMKTTLSSFWNNKSLGENTEFKIAFRIIFIIITLFSVWDLFMIYLFKYLNEKKKLRSWLKNWRKKNSTLYVYKKKGELKNTRTKLDCDCFECKLYSRTTSHHSFIFISIFFFSKLFYLF